MMTRTLYSYGKSPFVDDNNYLTQHFLNRSALIWPGVDPENSERGEWDTWQSKTVLILLR